MRYERDLDPKYPLESLKIFSALFNCVYCSFNSHNSLPLLLRHIAYSFFLLGRFEIRALTQSHNALSRFFVENVVFTLLRTFHSAVGGYAKTLFRAAVAFHFRHNIVLRKIYLLILH